MPEFQDRNAVARAFAQICSEAAVAIMEVYETDFEVRDKNDASPVSDADELAEEIILKRLSALFPNCAVIAEERFSRDGEPVHDDRFILVDPVDGTREFISRNGEFTVNIALVERGIPIAGCVYAPALGRIYLGGTEALAGTLTPGQALSECTLVPIHAAPRPEKGLRGIVSRSHADEQALAYATAAGVSELLSAGSSLKFCLLAEGKADIYPRFGPTREWDTAAGHAVLAAAGGRVVTQDGAPFLYGKREMGYLNSSFVAWGGTPEGSP